MMHVWIRKNEIENIIGLENIVQSGAGISAGLAFQYKGLQENVKGASTMGNQEKKGHIGGMKQERTPGEIVAARRKQMCWSQEELEWRSGLSRTQIGRIERDQVKPTYETIEKLEEALGISLKEEFVKYRKDRSEEKRSVNPKRKEIRKMARLLVESVLSADEIENLLMRRGQETEISNNRGV